MSMRTRRRHTQHDLANLLSPGAHAALEHRRRTVPPNLIKELSGMTSSKYYSYVTAALLAPGGRDSLGRRVPARVLLSHAAFSVVCMFFSMCALHSVRDWTKVIADWQDDAVFGNGNRPVYTYFQVESGVSDSRRTVAWLTPR